MNSSISLRFRLVALGLSLAAATGLVAQTHEKSGSPAQQIRAVTQEYQTAQAEFSKLYGSAKTDEEREKLRSEKMPDPKKYAARLLDLAEKQPSDAATLDALVWLATTGYQTDEAGKALSILARDHAAHEKAVAVCNFAPYIASSASGEFLRAVLEKSAKREHQAQACQSLYTYSLSAAPPDADKYLNLLGDKYGDLKNPRGSSTYGEFAKTERELNQTFGIGKPAPEIEGEDIDGTKFKLSDYRGKVVVIDFWGDW